MLSLTLQDKTSPQQYLLGCRGLEVVQRQQQQLRLRGVPGEEEGEDLLIGE
jgi:hypothetical protein